MSQPVYPSSNSASLKNLEFEQVAAVQNTWYTALNVSKAELNGIAVGITVADETVETRIVIDGVTYASGGIALLFAGNAWTSITGLRINNSPKTLTMGAASASVDMQNTTATQISDIFYGKSVKVEVRKTTAAGVSSIRVRGVYHVR